MWSNQDVRGFPPHFVTDDETRGSTRQDGWWVQFTRGIPEFVSGSRGLPTDELLPRAAKDGSVYLSFPRLRLN